MNNSQKIAELKAEIAKLEAEQKGFDALSDDKKLAIALHRKQCRWSHIDQCGWEYQSDYDERTWTGHNNSRVDYLKKARALMEKLPNTPIKDLLELVSVL
jgi:hypothetical protein